jgi:hypothetical protein
MQQFSSPAGQAPLPNPQAMPPMLQPAQQSPLAPQQPMGQMGQLPTGIDPRAVAANPSGFQQWQQQALAQEAAMPGSTMFAPQQPAGQMGLGGLGQGMGALPPQTAANTQNMAPMLQQYLASGNQQSALQQPAGQMTGWTPANQMPSSQNLATQGITQQQLQAMPTAQKAYAEGGAVNAPSPQAWMPPPNRLPMMPPQRPIGQMPPQGMPQQPPMGQMPQQMPMGQMPPQMPQRFAVGGSVTPMPTQDQLGGTQIAPVRQHAQGGMHHDTSSTPVDDQMLAQMQKNPQFDQVISATHEQMGNIPLDALNELIKMVRFAMLHPKKYPEIRAAAIRDHMVEPDDMPEQFDVQFLATMLSTMVALKKRQEAKGKEGFASGGLASAAKQLQAKGRYHDTILAHISPQEAAMLRANGGAGTINPATGLPEYLSFSSVWKDIKNAAKIVAPIILTALVPAAGAYLGTFLTGTLGATAAGIVGTTLAGGLAGAAGAAIQGTDIGKGAIFGGITGGLGGALGAGANALGKAAGLTKGLSTAAQGYIGAGLAGAGAAKLTGEDWKQGALKGLASRYVSNKLQNFAPVKSANEWMQGKVAQLTPPQSTPAMEAVNSLKDAGFEGNTFVAGQQVDPATGEVYKPNIEAASTYTSPDGMPNLDANGNPVVETGGRYINQGPTAAAGTPAAPAAPQTLAGKAMDAVGSGLQTSALVGAVGLLSGSGAPPPPAVEAIKTLSPEQQAYFNRPTVRLDYNRMMQNAAASGMSLAQFMNQNWSTIQGGAYNVAEGAAPPTPKARGGQAYATGGALSKMAYLAQGSGSGRADTIDAKLSDGEFVVDAETVALLGDGSTKEGARRLNMMREQLRQQKGAALSKGKFSPAAKSPLAYMAGAR